ncbi:hypothetical protein [Terrisporobacter petrolearius]|uniref:hypothetical protein n=1 Tax=Terrisporobacter petrolearius TaxID=1460447 RepID=UPI003B009DA4
MTKKLTAYTSTSGKKKIFTINKGCIKYIRVKNSFCKYGYVKVRLSMLFTENLCLWCRYRNIMLENYLNINIFTDNKIKY